LPARGGLKSTCTLPELIERITPSFPSIETLAPIVGVTSLDLNLLKGITFILFGSLGPNAFSGGISIVISEFSSNPINFSSTLFKIQPSPMIINLGS